jgi:glycosyltransferase involved in cell wall biosynthesis
MATGLRALGWQVDVVALDGSFPAPTPAALAQAAQALAALPDGALVLVDGLAFGAMPHAVLAHRDRLRLVALIHHPLAHETGLDAARASALRAAEIAALAAARAVIVTSPETATLLVQEFGVPAARIEVVEPGTEMPLRQARRNAAQRIAADAADAADTSHTSDSSDTSDTSNSSGTSDTTDAACTADTADTADTAGTADTDGNVDTATADAGADASVPLRLLCVASVVPRKGHDLLLRALAGLGPARRARLDCIGSTTRDPAHAARMLALAAALGLEAQVHFHGECPTAVLETAYAAADLFVLPAWYEGYGMAVAEALAHGLPVVATAVGAAPRLVGDEAGLLVPPGDSAALAGALCRLLADPALRRRLAAGARRRAAGLPRWDDQAARLASRLEAVAAA